MESLDVVAVLLQNDNLHLQLSLPPQSNFSSMKHTLSQDNVTIGEMISTAKSHHAMEELHLIGDQIFKLWHKFLNLFGICAPLLMDSLSLPLCTNRYKIWKKATMKKVIKLYHGYPVSSLT